MRLKKNCNGCRALNGKNCSLGYRVEDIYFERCIIVGSKPLELCPKPKTYDAYMKLINKSV